MKHLLNLYTIIAIAVLSIAFGEAQTGSATQHFEKDGLAFDYPFGWTLTDNTTRGLQSMTIAPEGTGAQIIVSVERTLQRSCDFQAELKNITTALVEKVAGQIQAASPVRTSPVKTQVDKSEAEGAQLQGVVDRKRVTADVYAVRLNQHFVSLIYIRNDQDSRAQSAWEMVRKTMKLATGVMVYGSAPANESGSAKAPESDSASAGNFLNGRALALPKPSYPPIARSARASGTIVVQVVIDEMGNVISAHAVSGHPLLAPVSVAAAREAKFSPPRFCGEPLRVTGVITYHFVAQ